MSVISDKSSSHRRLSQKSLSRMGRPGVSTRIGGYDSDQRFLLPHFSAAASEGIKIDMEDNWAENTTVITGNTSEHSYSGVTERFYVQQPVGRVAARRCSRLCWICSAFLISVVSLVSAPLMAATPFIFSHLNYQWPPIVCEVDCQGYILDMGFKIVLLIIAVYMMYWRRAPADMPRLFLPRAAFACFVLFILFAFWLFFAVRIVLERNPNYTYVISFALSLLNVLLFIHGIWLVYEMRQLRPEFIVTIVRDPDGESRTFDIGQMSIQEAAVHILRFYMAHFPSYNAFLDKARRGENVSRFKAGASQIGTGFKIYDIEGLGATEGGISEASARILMEAAARRRMTGHNERFYEELEWEKRLKKRKFRLVGCAEDAFAHVQAVNVNAANHKIEPMDVKNTAHAVMGGLWKPLTRYLRLTRQVPHHLPDKVTAHLQTCLLYRFSARTFLQRFFSERFPPKEIVTESKWSIICDVQASSSIRHGLNFVLRCYNQDSTDMNVQLYCAFAAFPFFNLLEESERMKSKFALKISNESAI